MALLFTQSYRDSGFEGLIPLGLAYAKELIGDGKADAIRKVRESFEKGGVEFVFNCQVSFWSWGHPDNGKYTCEIIGDAYKMPTDRDGNLVPYGNGQKATGKVSVRKGWQFRCGLVTLDQESIS